MTKVEKQIRIQDIPGEVQWVWAISHSQGAVGMETYREIQRIIADFPAFFPWEQKHRSIPQAVHQAYLREAHPWIFDNSPLVCSREGISGLNARMSPQPKEGPANEQEKKALWDKHYQKYGLEYR